MTAFSTLDPCEAAVQNTAVKITINDLLYVRSQKSILFGKTIIIDPFKFFEMVFNTLIILRIFKLTGSVHSRYVGHVLVPLR